MISKYKYFLVLFLFFDQNISVFAMYDRQCPIEFDSEKLLEEMVTKSLIEKQKKLILPKSKIKSELIDIPVNKTLKELTGVNNYSELKDIFSGEKSALIKLTKTVLDLSVKNELALLNIKSYWERFDENLNLKVENLAEKKFYYVKKGIEKNGSKIIIIGDIHGNAVDFDLIIEDLIKKDILGQDLKLTENYKIISLGDYIDRGINSLNIILTFMILRLINGEDVIILKGNHEDSLSSMQSYDFLDELREKLDWDGQSFSNYFKLLPVAYFVKVEIENNFFMFSHAGWCGKNNFLIEEFLKKDNIFLKIDEDQAKGLLWYDINFASKNRYENIVSPRGAGILNLSYQIVLFGMVKFGITAKFNGHTHMHPKGATESDDNDLVNYLSPGFTYQRTEIDEDTKIYTLISGTIKPYDKNKLNIQSDNLEYFPSYLILSIYNKMHDVDGYFKSENKSDFTRIDVKRWNDCWEYRYF
jgi:hypothetical protein